MFTIKTLQQRLIIFLILPVAVFLFTIGVAGYFYIRGTIYEEWQEAAVLRLERAAHYMDMRLNEPLQWTQSLVNTGGDRQGTGNQNWILQKLRGQPGVSQVSLKWQEPQPGGAGIAQEGRGGGGLAPRVAKVSPPEFFYPPDQKTVGLKTTLLNEAGQDLGRLEVIMKLDYLMEGNPHFRLVPCLYGLSGERTGAVPGPHQPAEGGFRRGLNLISCQRSFPHGHNERRKIGGVGWRPSLAASRWRARRPAPSSYFYIKSTQKIIFVILSAAKNLAFRRAEILYSARLRSE
jgi:hypothetical protein